MGNCSTEQEHIQVPEQPTTKETPYIRPDPTILKIPQLITPCAMSIQGIEKRITKLATNPKEPPELSLLLSSTQSNPFVDPTFKAQRKSVGDKLIIEHLEWKRPMNFLRQDQVYMGDHEGHVESYEFKQGRLEDSYFVSAMAVLAGKGEGNGDRLWGVVRDLVGQGQGGEGFGGYLVWLFVDGMWRKIVVDDMFPTSHNNYMLSNYKNQLWMWLIQKAYAKVFKSYEHIQRGFIGPLLTTLTGAPYEYLTMKQTQLTSADTAWQFIRQNFEKGHFLSISTQSPSQLCSPYMNQTPSSPMPTTMFPSLNSSISPNLGSSAFSYPVLDCQQVYILTTMKKKKERILKLSNPWNRYEWKGRWSEYSDVWSEELRRELGYQKADDSVMWINLEDLLKNFAQICVCKYRQGWISSSLGLTFNQQLSSQLKSLFMQIPHHTTGYLTLYQSDHRKHPASYSYSMIKQTLVLIDKQTGRMKSTVWQKIFLSHSCTIEIELDAGLYYLLVEVDWACAYSREITVAVYADSGVGLLQDLSMPSPEQIFYELVGIEEGLGHVLEVYEYPFDKDIKRIKGVFGGYVYYHYINNSKDNKYLTEAVKLGDSEHLAVVGENSSSEFSFKLMPGQQKLVKMKILQQGGGSYRLSATTRNQVFQNYSKQNLLQLLKKKPTKSRQRVIQQQLIDVYVKTFEYSGGVALLYINDMTKHSYIEEIVFQFFNLKLEGDEELDDNRISIQLDPHEEKMLSFVIIDPTKQYNFKTKVEYYLGTPEFKF